MSGEGRPPPPDGLLLLGRHTFEVLAPFESLDQLLLQRFNPLLVLFALLLEMALRLLRLMPKCGGAHVMLQLLPELFLGAGDAKQERGKGGVSYKPQGGRGCAMRTLPLSPSNADRKGA